MTIFYLDPVNGNDTNDGSSWALAWKTISSGATAARTSPGDTIRIAKSPDPVSIGNATWTGVSRATGGDINFSYAASTATTPIQITRSAHGFATGDLVMVTGYTTNYPANGLWVVTRTNDDVFTLDGSVGIIAETSGAFEKCNYRTVTLATAQTLAVEKCEAPIWAVANSSTITLQPASTGCKQGGNAMKFAMAAPANSTLYGYRTIASTDYSSYQKLSFWIQNSTAILTDQWYICLCSDTAGAVIVDIIKIPAIASVSNFLPLTLAREGGGNLGSTIQSVALYSGTSAGATTGLVLDNIIACTTNGLNLQSLISKSSAAQGGTECWFGIQSIDDIYVMLDQGHSSNPSYNGGSRGYYGATGLATTYKRETVKTSLATTDYQPVQEIQEAGTLGNLIAYEGGYDTATTIQDGETIFDGLNGYGYGLYFAIKSYISLNQIGFCHYNVGIQTYNGSSYNNFINVRAMNNGETGIQFSSGASFNTVGTAITNNNTGTGVNGYSSSDCTFGTVLSHGNSNYGYNTGGVNWVSTTVRACNNGSGGIILNDGNCTIVTAEVAYSSYGVYFYGSSTYGCSIATINFADYCSYGVLFGSSASFNYIGTITQVNNNTSYGVLFQGGNFYNFIKEILAANYNSSAVSFSNTLSFNRINSLSTAGNTLNAVNMGSMSGINYLRNALMAEATKIGGTITGFSSKLYSWKHQQTTDSHYVVLYGATMQSTATAGKRHTASGIAWQVSPTSSRPIYSPVVETLAEIAVNANKLVTVSCWVLKDHATNVGASIFCRGNQLAGVPSNIETLKANDTSYEQLVMTFTPTEAGVITIEMKAWYVAATNCVAYFDDLSVVQDS